MGDMLTRIMQDIVRRKSGDQVPSTSAPISE
jgi:hypothetical protein